MNDHADKPREWIPTTEIQATSFPYQGQGVRMGILDTGVDPNAVGLGSKVVELMDCSGSGDVDVSYETVALWNETAQAYHVQGLSGGRAISLPGDWTYADYFPTSSTKKSNSNGDEKVKDETKESNKTSKDKKGKNIKSVPIRLGVKRAYELYPRSLKSRIEQDRQTIFTDRVQSYAARVRRQLAELSSNIESSEQKLQRDEYQAQLDVLTAALEKDDMPFLSDPGPLLDCVVWYDGMHYRAVVVADDDDDDSQSLQPLAAYGVERQLGTLGIRDQLNYGVQFEKDGTVLTLVIDGSGHGSHVAGIAASAEPDRPGVASAAELVSLKVGDSRLTTIETGTALTRALIQAIRLKCDVINLSYGEATTVPNAGRFVQLANALVRQHQIVFVASAGNNGPALSTVGAPGGTTSSIWGVGAYVSPEMQQTAYGLVGSLDRGTTFTFSSVGPTADGARGPAFLAPGGAIASVPNWSLQKRGLKNGTSMSAPNAAGCVALLISACRAEGIPVSPARLRLALENTCRVLPHLTPLEQGSGLIQIDQALEYLRRYREDPYQDVFFDVSINRVGKPRGIYLRDEQSAHTRQTFSVEVQTAFPANAAVSQAVQDQKVDFEMELRLESSAPSWVVVPPYFLLVSNGRSFSVAVDPSQLEAGLHTTEVVAYRTMEGKEEPVFRVPITVCKPLPVQRAHAFGKLSFSSAQVKRFFAVPPSGATWMDVTLRDCRSEHAEDISSRSMALRVQQILPNKSYRDHEKRAAIAMLPNKSYVTSVAVEEGVVCEICLARTWSNLMDLEIEASVEFRGIRPVPNTVSLVAGGGGAMVRLHSDLQDESIKPSATLTHWQTPLRPKTEATPVPLGDDRDVFPSSHSGAPDQTIHKMILEYEFEQDEAGSFTPRAYALQDVLYDSAFESQLMLVFDGEKKYLGCSDAYASEVTAPKGTVCLRLQVRHDDPAKLLALKDMVLWIERPIGKDIALSVYPTKEAMVTNGDAFKRCLILQGGCKTVYISEPAQSKLPSNCKAGDILKGRMSFGAGDKVQPGEGKRPGGYPVSFVVGPKPKKTSNNDNVPEPKDERSVETKMAESVRDLKISHLVKAGKQAKGDGIFDTLFAELEEEYPDHLPLHVAKLRDLDGRKSMRDHKQVVACADDLIQRIDEDALALHFGRKVDTEDAEASKEREDMKEKRSFLIEALVRKAMAQSDDPKIADDQEPFFATLKHLKAWADIDSSDKYSSLVLIRDTLAGRHGLVIKTINKLLNKTAKEDSIRKLNRNELLTKRAGAFEKLGFEILKEYDRAQRVIASPKSYSLF